VQAALARLPADAAALRGSGPERAGGARRRFGILRRVDYRERVCDVDWVGYCNADCSREVTGDAARAEEAAACAEGGRPAMPLGLAEVSVYPPPPLPPSY
jgi:hypothetical protein